MAVTTRSSNGRFRRTLAHRWLAAPAMSGSTILLAGCAILGGAVAVALLTGFFVGAIQATFAATARSYAFTDFGSVQLVFSPPDAGRSTFLAFNGRLPGFHFVLKTGPNKAAVAAQDQEEILFETDVQIDFSAAAPTISGTISEVDGDQEFDFADLYNVTSIIPWLTDPDEEGNRELVITIQADSLADGGELKYTLRLDTNLDTSGNALTGTVQVTRELTIDGEDIVIESEEGSLDATKEAEEPPQGNDNGAGQNENTQDNANAGEDQNDNGTGENANQDGGPGDGEGNGNEGAALPDTPSECVADLSGLAPGVADVITAALDAGLAGLDRDGSGEVTADEVQQTVDNVLVVFGLSSPLTEEEAQCVADVANG